MKRYRILVVDDEPANLQKLKRTFIEEHHVMGAGSGEEALAILQSQSVDVIITDQKMPGMSGVELLEKSIAVNPEIVRIVLTGYTEVDDLIDAINTGRVYKYITKPWEPTFLRIAVRKALEQLELVRENRRLSSELAKANEKLRRENQLLKTQVETYFEPDNIIYESRSMHEILSLLSRVVQTDSTVLIQGETGTGKELVARYLHQKSRRKDEIFVPVNCGAVPKDLAESAFFGHAKGAFTGASAEKKGFFEMADRGTLFLDEIGEAPLDLQVKFLRVLEDNVIQPVGSQQPRTVDVRVVASTNRNLREEVEKGNFRQDLFYRINVFSVYIPPLRARKEDIAPLAEYFVHRIGFRLNKKELQLAPETVGILENYHWPGNVRELENEVERMVILGDGGVVTPDLISDHVRGERVSVPVAERLKEKIGELEKQMILETLQAHNQNKSHAARTLGISRQTLIAKLKKIQGELPQRKDRGSAKS
ncbi:MAG: sigma-54-dependent Fis family transcriptional regulator [Acidobacteria bacterium]|nr:sigma-54-dependent Fis family transcriptional regulator [Acidobacteriota bacterium]